MSSDPSLIELSAVEVVERLRHGDVTPHDCLDALEARITSVEPLVNALPTLAFDRARAACRPNRAEADLRAGVAALLGHRDLGRVFVANFALEDGDRAGALARGRLGVTQDDEGRHGVFQRCGMAAGAGRRRPRVLLLRQQ